VPHEELKGLLPEWQQFQTMFLLFSYWQRWWWSCLGGEEVKGLSGEKCARFFLHQLSRTRFRRKFSSGPMENRFRRSKLRLFFVSALLCRNYDLIPCWSLLSTQTSTLVLLSSCMNPLLCALNLVRFNSLQQMNFSNQGTNS